MLQVDGSKPHRATSPVGSNVLVSDGRYWIGNEEDIYAQQQLPPTDRLSYGQKFAF